MSVWIQQTKNVDNVIIFQWNPVTLVTGFDW